MEVPSVSEQGLRCRAMVDVRPASKQANVSVGGGQTRGTCWQGRFTLKQRVPLVEKANERCDGTKGQTAAAEQEEGEEEKRKKGENQKWMQQLRHLKPPSPSPAKLTSPSSGGLV